MILDLRIALASLAAHRLRTILAMTGIFLGALAFTGVQTMSQIMVRFAEVEVEKMGPNLFSVMAGQVRFGRGGVRFADNVTTLTVSDARELAGSLPGVATMAPMAQQTLPIRAEGVTVNGLVTATWPEYQRVRSFYPAHGRFFTHEEERDLERVVVLGTKIAERIFGGREAALGRQVFIYRAGFRVVGVMEEKGRDLAGVDQDEQVFMPLSTYMRRASNTDYIKSILMELREGESVERLREAATAILRQRHALGKGEDDDFSLLEAKDAMQLQRDALNLMSTLGVIVSTISFAVGGLGILSIMVLLVRARRKEIGIRRAVGGTKRDIVRQFVLESALMSVTGGTLGVVVCLALVVVFTSLSTYPLVLDPLVPLAAVLGSAVLGLGAGAYPAWQASRIEILDVLSG
ncbi:MAG: ABC transporter permease [Desulfovibrionaceae bacterium]